MVGLDVRADKSGCSQRLLGDGDVVHDFRHTGHLFGDRHGRPFRQTVIYQTIQIYNMIQRLYADRIWGAQVCMLIERCLYFCRDLGVARTTFQSAPFVCRTSCNRVD